jgi:hypothetical protein
MAPFPLATGARLLGIHPKTLHHWLKAANVPVAPHPTAARSSCVAQEHLLEGAKRHSRPLPELSSAAWLEGQAMSGLGEEQAQLLPRACSSCGLAGRSSGRPAPAAFPGASPRRSSAAPTRRAHFGIPSRANRAL